MTDNMYYSVHKYIINAICTTPMHIGSATGEKSDVLIHPINEMPFMQASSISGVLRAASVQINGESKTNDIFGCIYSNGNVDSAVKISDGLFDKRTIKMEYRPHVRINPKTGTVSTSVIKGSGESGGQKFETESIGSGSEFSFTVYLYKEDEKEALEKIFSALINGDVQFGGQKSNGSGFINVKSVLHKEFLMKSPEDRKLWAKENTLPKSEYKEMVGELKKNTVTSLAYKINLIGKTEGHLLVKGIAVGDYKDKAPDADNIRNSDGEYIIPGSSLKGVLRSRMTYIADRLSAQGLIDDAFGTDTDESFNKHAGNIIVKDTVIGKHGENDNNPISYRIHIDKFTGGVISGALFSEKNVHGNLSAEIDIANRFSPDASAGLTILALRDIAYGLANIGSGYSMGKGIFDVEKIIIKRLSDGKESVIDIKKQTVDDKSEVIKRCLQAVGTERSTNELYSNKA